LTPPQEGNHHGKTGISFNKIGRAVQWINDPQIGFLRQALTDLRLHRGRFFAEHNGARENFHQARGQQSFRLPVRSSDQLAWRFFLNLVGM
jgi:hypothetical protein